jgi:hypothetical protein
MNFMRVLIKNRATQKADARIKGILLEVNYFTNKCRRKVICPSKPMLGTNEYKILKSLASDAARFIEYGSGGSTKFISEHTRELVTVESDKLFLAAVIYSNRNNGNTSFLHANIGPTKSFGQPIRVLKLIFKNKWSSYAVTPWNFLGEKSQVDAIFIDGRFRVHCFLQCLLLNSAEKYSILVDDYFKRSEYFVMEEASFTPERVGDAALFRISRADIDQRLILKLAERYKHDFN